VEVQVPVLATLAPDAGKLSISRLTTRRRAHSTGRWVGLRGGLISVSKEESPIAPANQTLAVQSAACRHYSE